MQKPLKCEFQRTNACSNFQIDKVPNPTKCTELNTLSWVVCHSLTYGLLEEFDVEEIALESQSHEEHSASQPMVDASITIDENEDIDSFVVSHDDGMCVEDIQEISPPPPETHIDDEPDPDLYVYIEQ